MASPPAEAAARRPRDPRLDFFRGAAMLVILIAHIPGNRWTLWIPARLGFSDATEIFVFCSGMASALAFGAVFATRGWLLGASRVAFRAWQVYWAHLGVFLVTVAMLAAIDLHGWGLPGKTYIEEPYVAPFLDHTGLFLPALLTLRYVPGLFDILPMYLVVLAMIPLVMALHRAGGVAAVGAFMAASWLGATLAGLSLAAGPQAGGPIGAIGAALSWMVLPAEPDASRTWFFNPFAWQLVFFTGFAFGMGWLPAPPRSRRLAMLAALVLVLSLPIAWNRIHEGFFIVQGGPTQLWLAETRAALAPLWDKTWFGLFRYVHFLALAYLAWFVVGPLGVRLSEGWRAAERAPAQRLRRAAAACAVALLTLPAVLYAEIAARAPGAAEAMVAFWPALATDRNTVFELIHLAALIALGWNIASEATRDWIARELPARITPVVRKVGTQSLAVFMTSIPLSQALGLALDLAGRNVWTTAAANLGGCALLIATAYLVSWFKSHPWRAPRPAPAQTGAPTMSRLQAAE